MGTPRTPNILIVDDEPDVRAYVCEALARESFRCTSVEGPQQALAVVKRTPVDVALLDISSTRPEDSVWLARRLRDEVRDLAVLVVGTKRCMDTAIEAMRIGVIDYLLKPVSTNDLLDAVDRAMQWRLSALAARSAAKRQDEDMTARMTRLVRAFGESAIASTTALDVWLANIYRSDAWTLDHVRRVAHLSSVLALMMGIDDALVGHIERAGLLHDVGKLAIPPDIIRKPGPLTSDQLACVRRHVQAGYEIASATPFLAPAADIVLATRERYDGTGYPRGLRGESIPLGGRIIAVVEVFDALTSARSQMDPVSMAAAHAEMVRGAGRRFDPDVVRAWLRSMDADVLNARSPLLEGALARP